jgi:prepilin-type processing-associated H-X9-DG protein
MALACHNFASLNGRFPYGRKYDIWDAYTWSELILPYIEQQAVYDGYFTLLQTTGTPADSTGMVSTPLGPAGTDQRLQTSRTTIIPTYSCPSDIAPVPNQLPATDATYGTTFSYYRYSYRGCVGSGDSEGGTVSTTLTSGGSAPSKYIGVFGVTADTNPASPRLVKGVSFADITDGTSQTLLLSEGLVPGVTAGWGGNWGETLYGNMGGGLFSTALTPNSGLPDMLIGYCPQQAGDLSYNSQCTQITKNTQGQPCAPGSYAAARSYHPGGVNAAMADGSVNFFNNTIDTFTWQSLGTQAGGEMIPSKW